MPNRRSPSPRREWLFISLRRFNLKVRHYHVRYICRENELFSNRFLLISPHLFQDHQSTILIDENFDLSKIFNTLHRKKVHVEINSSFLIMKKGSKFLLNLNLYLKLTSLASEIHQFQVRSFEKIICLTFSPFYMFLAFKSVYSKGKFVTDCSN